MKTLNICAVLLISIFATSFSFAQTSVKKETIKVWGNCGICKKNIEKAAKVGGASTANWNEETKVLNVSYNAAKSNSDKIQKSVAASGYDTEKFQADEKAYNHLMSCCQYERNTAFPGGIINAPATKMECKDMKCCKDNKCCADDAKCDKDCMEMAECKEMKCCKS